MKTLEEETKDKKEEPFPKKKDDFLRDSYEKVYTPEQAKKEHPLFYECWKGIN